MERYLYEDLFQLEEYHWWHRAKRRVCIELIKKYRPGPTLEIIDIGCGTGKNMMEFRQFGEPWGLDSASQALNYCLRRGLYKLLRGQAQHMPLGDNQFDVATLLDILEHTDDLKTLAEMYRILHREAILIMNVPAYAWLWSKWDEVLRHRKRYTKKSLKKLLQFSGFEVCYTSYLFSFLVIPTFILRKFKSLRCGPYSSDFRIGSPLANKLMFAMFSIEDRIRHIFTIPFGTSLVCVARKK
jgi:ubiquinone/menaquinone biosynthesis C-methylase UbiE